MTRLGDQETSSHSAGFHRQRQIRPYVPVRRLPAELPAPVWNARNTAADGGAAPGHGREECLEETGKLLRHATASHHRD